MNGLWRDAALAAVLEGAAVSQGAGAPAEGSAVPHGTGAGTGVAASAAIKEGDVR